MGITAISGPHLVYGISIGSTGNVTEYNEERGPSLFDLGVGTADPRGQYYGYDPGSPVGTQVKGFFDQMGFVDYIPFTATASAILVSSASGAPVAGTALTLAPISSQGAFTTTIIAPETGRATSVIAIDSTAATLNYGTGGTISIWNPAAGTGRTILVVNSSNANSEQYIVRGRDMYGFKMTETISASTTSTGSGQGKKAFKYIVSVTPSTATTISATGVAIGFADTFGLPLYMPYTNGVSVWASSLPNASNLISLTSANTVLASTAVTATTTTADVRGTYTSSIATNGTSANGANGGAVTSTGVRVTMLQQITAPMCAAISLTANTSAWFGVTQFSDF